MKDVSIYGAGLAGLVAAVNLAREGLNVTIYEREDEIGGSKDLHPSVHSTPMQPKETWDYIGIDLSSHFVKTDAYPNMWYNRKRLTLPPYVHNMSVYNVERGARPSSVDVRLFEIAQDEGVDFEFGRALTPDELAQAPPGSIIATGLYKAVYDLVGVKNSLTYGYMALSNWEKGKTGGAIYMGNFSVDYGYSAWINGIMYVLLFSRKPLNEKDLSKFKKVIRDVEGFESEKWVTADNGHFPRELRLFWKDKILAGTLSGMIEPFWAYGVVGALLSGKVAAKTWLDREKGYEDFSNFNRGFDKKLARKEKMDSMPFNKQMIRLAMLKARYNCWRHPEIINKPKDPVRWFR